MRMQIIAGMLMVALPPGDVHAMEWPQKHEDCMARMPANQREINECARLEYLESERELNSLYQRLLKVDPNASALSEAQRAWLHFRDNVCLYEQGFAQPGGSAAGMYHQDCLTRHTRRRIEDLRRGLQKYQH